MNSALILVDLQVMPFIWKEHGGKPLFKEDALLANVNHLIKKAQNANIPIFTTYHTEKEPSFRVEGSPLWNFHPEILIDSSAKRIVKYHPDSFQDTTLFDRLRKMNITHLFVAGLQTEYCVDTLIRSGYRNNFLMTLVSDGHSTYDSDTLNASDIIAHHNDLLSVFATIQSSADVNFSSTN